ncbi:MAG TPA: VWA domain-containing protein, partial [Pyrinomonadaceae bacterium]|nr:VWA domain-containing protein [Pyrinomonadaceae bacterium]
MLLNTLPFRRALLLLPLCCISLASSARAQQQTPSPTPEPADEIIRVNAELVQTDVIVLDKQGKFVDGLRPEQFELRVNGKPQSISFFERVTAGSTNEDVQLAAARGNTRPTPNVTPANNPRVSTSPKPLDRGRVIIFFIDDLHLSAGSLARTRALLLRYIEEQMGQNDQAVVATASNQLGFLQQLSDDKRVLRTAASRLSLREVVVRDFQRPQMTELQALVIEQNDPNVLNYFVDATLKENPTFGDPRNARVSAESQVRRRASQLVQQTASAAVNTLNSLRSLMRSMAQLPGRKLVYLISDGFPVELRRSEITEGLRRVTDAALRAGVVVYTLDARGLTADMTGMPDVTSDAGPDPAGQLAMGSLNETTARQEPLRIIAADTGGRALLNTNALDDALVKSIKETSVYYLLAWRPEGAEQRGGRFQRLEVNIKDRADVSVLVQRGFYTTPPAEPSRAKDTKRQTDAKEKELPAARQNKELLAALHSLFPKSALPTSLALNYLNLPPRGMILTTTIQVERGATAAPAGAPAGDKTPPEQIEVVGALYDERGELKNSFQRRLNVTPNTPATSPYANRVIVSSNLAVTPGIYQVRIAARDPLSGRTGSAAQWIEIPDLAKGKLSLSSVFIGEQTSTEIVPAKDAPEDALPVVISVDGRLARTSRMRFFIYVYNAARALAANAPDVALQVQVFRDGQPVITSPLRKLETEGMTDLTSLPYAAELPLNGLASGRYALQITAIDRVSKT